jgi:Uma2 family endonuclease
MTQAAVSSRRSRGPGKITYEQFLKRYEGIRAEWVDGEVELKMSVSKPHNEVTRFLLLAMGALIEEQSLGEIFFTQVQMKLPGGGSGREPYLVFVRTERLELVRRQFIDGPGDLVVEVVRPESQGRDRKVKFREYEAGGVREYWLIDPDKRRAEFYVLQDEHFERREPDAEGVYRSATMDGFWLRVAWRWEPPAQKEVRRALGI